MNDVSPLVIGHRGAPGHFPEHTRSSYLFAIEHGVDAVEPDIVPTKDGVLVIRHENEISGTTDVEAHAEFAHLRTTKMIDGQALTGWFTEDFTWAELATLRCRERLPKLRPDNTAYDGAEPILRLGDLLDLLDGTDVGLVLEIKHATYFAAVGLDLVPLIERDLAAAGWDDGEHGLIIECFEQDALTRLQQAGLPSLYVYLLEDEGTAADLVDAGGPSYAEQLTLAGLDVLAEQVDGISLDKTTIQRDAQVVADAQARGLMVFTWTARPENAFLSEPFRSGRREAFGDYAGEWALLQIAGVDGVFVDHADLGVAFFRE